MTQPIIQHWVPRFYLKHFATPDTATTKNPKTWIFSKDGKDGAPLLTSIRNVCAKRYLYSPIGNDGQREWSLESKLATLESTLAEFWPNLAVGYVDFARWEPLRRLIALFIAVTYLRHPDRDVESINMHRDIVEAFEQAPKRFDGVPDVDLIEVNGREYEFDPSDWEGYRAWDKNEHCRFFVNMVHSQATHLAELLLKKRWSIILSDRPAFVTSDNPVGKQHQERKRFGFGTEGSIISFPLSPTRLLLMDDMHKEPANQYYPLRDDDAGPLNLMTFSNCRKFMISAHNIDYVLAEIVAWADNYDKSMRG